MAPNLSWLHACKSVQLKAVAKAIGINSSGTKQVLISQLLQHLPPGNFHHDATISLPRNQFDIISIDMGIRNLAYCRLTLPQSPPPTKRPSNITPVISEWARIDISKNRRETQENKDVMAKEAFDPLTYSQHAYNLVSTLLSSTARQPTHILIERQRFRSMGGSAVQEWTLRVNMFEAMIYAVWKTLAKKGLWRGTVHSVTPARVSKFWLGDKEGVDQVEGGSSKSAKTKTAKIELVGRWLEKRRAGDSPFELEGKAAEMGTAFAMKRNGGRMAGAKMKVDASSKKTSTYTEIGKLDDLADCLLQGMAFIRWEQNRSMIMAKGLDALDHTV